MEIDKNLIFTVFFFAQNSAKMNGKKNKVSGYAMPSLVNSILRLFTFILGYAYGGV